jgi:mRNA-decapping enzyme 1B
MSAISVTEQARKQANLRLLQRTVDANIVDIVQTATHVVLYEYEAATAWQKTGFEGSLFLAQSVNSYQLIILNRNSPDNFQMPIDAQVQLQHDDPFVIFKQKDVNGETRIRGIWFHNADERILMAGVLQQTLQGLEEGRLPVQIAPAAPAPVAAAAPVTPNAWAARAASVPAAWSAVAAAPIAAAPVAAAPVAVAAAAAPVAVAVAAAAADPIAAGDPSVALAALLGVVSISGQAGAPPAAAAAATPPTIPQQQQQQQQAQTPAAMAAANPGMALDKKSLQLALLSLIQDDRFLDLVHSQYLRVVHARTKKGGSNQQ